jgi:hypothetical protein
MSTVIGSGGIQLQQWSTATRPAAPISGQMGFNTNLLQCEVFTGSTWTPVGAGATGGGTDHVFYQNGQTITTSYTITAGTSASSTGPITINTGAVITIPTGSKWVIL